MKDPIFLRLNEIVEIHSDQIARYGGSPGIRDMGLLQPAVAIPMSTFDGQFLHSNLHEMAATYLFHLVKNHPFVDGNKRVGTVAAIVVLELNGVEIEADEFEVERLVLDVIENRSSKVSVAESLRRNSKTCSKRTRVTRAVRVTAGKLGRSRPIQSIFYKTPRLRCLYTA